MKYKIKPNLIINIKISLKYKLVNEYHIRTTTKNFY